MIGRKYNKQADKVEITVSCLINKYFGQDIRPGKELEKQTWETLMLEVRRQQSRFTYPDFVLGILVACFMVIVVWSSIQVLNFREVFRLDSWMNIGLVIVLMNVIT